MEKLDIWKMKISDKNSFYHFSSTVTPLLIHSLITLFSFVKSEFVVGIW